MKKFLSLIALVLVATIGFAQVVVIAPVEREMSLGKQPALSVHINGVEADDAMKDFVSYWKSNGARNEAKGVEMKAPGYEPKDLKPSVFTLYATSEAEKDNSVIYLWANDGSTFVNMAHPAYKHFEKAMKDFGVAENKKPFEKQLKEQERALDKANNERTSLERQRENWKKDIDDCNKTIETTQAKLKASESDVAKTADQIKELERDTDKLKNQIDGIQ